MFQYPFSVFCIIAAEFCERFSFCGLRTILSLYLRNVLHYSENTSTVLYHIFIMCCYIVPVASAIIADSYIGNYKTILNCSIIYLFGCILTCASAFPVVASNSILLAVLGLTLVAFGTGGMKPCIAAFGAEQFSLPNQKDLLTNFFSIFYLTINLGGFVGMILVPVVKKSISCYGEDTCYALGFGLPMLLMALSLIFFIIGRTFYRIKTPKNNVILQFLKCGSYALGRKCKGKKKHENWLDYASDKYNKKIIGEMKIVCSILFLYIPLPIFWSLFDQQGSRWTFQASHMNGNFLGMVIVPDQIQVINPAMVFLLIPGFNRLLYPWFLKYNFLNTSLQRMAIGGIAAGVAFFIAGILELTLETTYPQFPDKQHSFLNIINTLPCEVHIQNTFNGEQSIQTGDIYMFKDIACLNCSTYKLTVVAKNKCGCIRLTKTTFLLQMKCYDYQIDTVLIGLYSKNEVKAYVIEREDFKKSLSGASRLRIAYLKSLGPFNNVTVTLRNYAGEQDVYYVPFVKSDVSVSTYMELAQGKYQCVIGYEKNPSWYVRSEHLALGGVYELVIRENEQGIAFMKLYTMSIPNTISMLWQIPQYLLISVAEIMFGIAGLEFSFTQAPKRLKTITIAGWYLSVAMGNFLVIFITQLNFFKSQAYEFFLFSILIVIDMVIFVEMSSNYEISHVADATVSNSVILTELSDYVDNLDQE